MRCLTGRPIAIVAAVLAVTPAAGAEGKSAVVTIEGPVVSLSSVPGEGGLPLVAATVEIAGKEVPRLQVLLAPAGVLDEIGFEVREGDRLRAKIFVEGTSPAPAHKVMNMTRGTMVRLRTMRRIPIWSAQGRWEGGPIRNRGKGGGHRGGRP